MQVGHSILCLRVPVQCAFLGDVMAESAARAAHDNASFISIPFTWLYANHNVRNLTFTLHYSLRLEYTWLSPSVPSVAKLITDSSATIKTILHRLHLSVSYAIAFCCLIDFLDYPNHTTRHCLETISHILLFCLCSTTKTRSLWTRSRLSTNARSLSTMHWSSGTIRKTPKESDEDPLKMFNCHGTYIDTLGQWNDFRVRLPFTF